MTKLGATGGCFDSSQRSTEATTNSSPVLGLQPDCRRCEHYPRLCHCLHHILGDAVLITKDATLHKGAKVAMYLAYVLTGRHQHRLEPWFGLRSLLA